MRGDDLGWLKLNDNDVVRVHGITRDITHRAHVNLPLEHVVVYSQASSRCGWSV